MPNTVPHNQSIKNEIVNVAMKEIAKNGLASLSLRKVTAKLGITTGVFYNQFKNEAELLTMIVQRASTIIYNQIYPDIKDYQKHPRESLVILGKDIIKLFKTSSEIMQMIILGSSVYHNDNLLVQLPFFTISKKVIYAATDHLDEQQKKAIFVQLWAFIQGYGLLISNQIYQFDYQEMKNTIYKL